MSVAVLSNVTEDPSTVVVTTTPAFAAKSSKEIEYAIVPASSS
jgi:hypothetical protein